MRPRLRLQAAALRETFGPHPTAHERGSVRLDVLAAVDEILGALEAGRWPPRPLVRGRPLSDWLGLDAVAAILGAAPKAQIARPVTDRRIGPYARCPRHPETGTWLYSGDAPVCRRCDEGELLELPATEPPPPTKALLALSRSRSAPAPREPSWAAPLHEQVRATLANGPKPARQIALELAVPLADVLRVLGLAVVEEARTPVPTMDELPEPDADGDDDDEL